MNRPGRLGITRVNIIKIDHTGTDLGRDLLPRLAELEGAFLRNWRANVETG